MDENNETEPTMDEILETINRIINEDESAKSRSNQFNKIRNIKIDSSLQKSEIPLESLRLMPLLALYRYAKIHKLEPTFNSFINSNYLAFLERSVQQYIKRAASISNEFQLAKIYPIPVNENATFYEKNLVSILSKLKYPESNIEIRLSMSFLELLAECDQIRHVLKEPLITERVLFYAFITLSGHWESEPFGSNSYGTHKSIEEELYGAAGFSARNIMANRKLPKVLFSYLNEKIHNFDLMPKKRRTVDSSQLPTMHSDRPDGAHDVLGIARDAVAFAKVIMLKQPGPPLAIGLFGDWGSGKSTFMQRMESECALIAEHQGSQQYSEPDDEFFVQNVVQIRFNAWHYAEADLWSSMAAHIFRSLFDAAHGDIVRRPSWLNPEAFKRLLEDLASAKASFSEATAGAEDARETLAKARVAAENTRRQRDLLVAARNGDPDAALALIGQRQDMRELDNALRTLGMPPVFGDARRFVHAARTLRTTWGRAKAWLNNTLSLTGAVWVAVGVILGGIIALSAHRADYGALANVAPPVVLAFLASVASAWKAIAPLLRAAQRAEEEATSAAQAAEGELPGAEKAYEDAETRLEQAERRRRGLEALIDADDPEAALNAFLHARLGEGGYHDRLGIVSRLYSDFESLSNLLESVENRRVEAEAFEAPKHLQRIVLYIDDLDRCGDATVVKVLESVHLLLALPLFVVVVGVDARWLEGALSRSYAHQLGEAGTASPSDYLEKIFQLPYWLPKLETKNGDETGYSRLIDALTGASPAADPVQVPEKAEEDAGAQEYGALEWSPIGDAKVIDQKVERRVVELSDAERGCMKVLGPLVGKSPRAVKRFVNSYMFHKARLEGAELDAFLGTRSGKSAFYPALMLQLAIDIGLPESTKKYIHIIDVMMMNGIVHDEAPERTLGAIFDFLFSSKEPNYDMNLVAKEYVVNYNNTYSSRSEFIPIAYIDSVNLYKYSQCFAAVYKLMKSEEASGLYDYYSVLQNEILERSNFARLSFRRPY